MRWQGRRQSSNVEDRRGRPAGGLIVGGGAGVVILLVALWLLWLVLTAVIAVLVAALPGVSVTLRSAILIVWIAVMLAVLRRYR